jgi:hypothetical protein
MHEFLFLAQGKWVFLPFFLWFSPLQPSLAGHPFGLCIWCYACFSCRLRKVEKVTITPLLSPLPNQFSSGAHPSQISSVSRVESCRDTPG